MRFLHKNAYNYTTKVWELGNLLAEGGDQLDLRGLIIPDEVTTIL